MTGGPTQTMSLMSPQSPEPPRRRRPRRRPRRLLRSTAVVGALVPLLLAPQVGGVPSAEADAWREAQYWLDTYGVAEAWKTTQGDGVRIAVMDTGIDAEHPALQGAVVGGTDVSGGGDSDGSPVEQMTAEHGTLVGSLAAGRGTEASGDDPEDLPDPHDFEDFSEQDWKEFWDDLQKEMSSSAAAGSGVVTREALTSGAVRASDLVSGAAMSPNSARTSGVVGVAPQADLLSISMSLEIPSSYDVPLEQQVVDGVDWAIEHDADIINMSFGLPNQQEWPKSWDRAFQRAEDNDVLVVAAAGNRISGQWSVGAPASIPGVVTVAGVTEEEEISQDASAQGIAVDLAAPSEPLVGAVPAGGYAQWSGTSGASPIVAGAAALVMAAHPDLPVAEVRHRLLTTAEDAGPEGVDPEFGRGILDVAAAVGRDDLPDYDAADYQSLADWVRIHRRGESDTSQHVDIPEDSGVTPGPEGEPRARPQPEEDETVQDWAGATTLGVAALVVLLIGAGAAAHLGRRRRRVTGR